jgi:hypothetical protein
VVVSRAVVNFSDLARQEALLPVQPQGPKIQPPEHQRPPRKPLPPGAIVKLAPQAAERPSAPAAVGPPAPRTVLLSNSFPAEADNNTVIPPDTQGTDGPNHLVVTLNSNVVVEDRFGNRLTTVSLDSFWAPTGNSVTTDPRVVYDPYNDRWIIATSGDFLKSTSGVLVGVSQTGDPTGNWNLYKVAVDSTHQHFCDFPVLGFNKKWVVVMCDVFTNGTNSRPVSGNIYVFDKFSLYNHGAGVPVVFDDNIDHNPNGGDSNVTPAITYDNNLETEYLVEEYNGNDPTSQNGLMRLWAITGAVNAPTLSSVAFPATSATWDEGMTLDNFAPQLGAATGIDTGDARIGNVIYNNGTLWTTHPVFYPCCAPNNPPNRSAIQWWQIDTGGNVLQRGVIDNPDGSYFRSYPSIAVNQYNDALIGYARFSGSEYAGGFYSFRADTDPPGVLEAETALKTGEAPYVKTAGGTSNRWGDYSNTSIDPVDNISFWTIQEYAAAPASRWATWWGQVVLPAAAFQASPSSMTVTAGVPLADLAVTVVDAQGHPAPAYTGTLHFTSTDPRFSLPDYTFVPSDQGTHHFSGVTLFTAGPQSITLTDGVNSIQATLNFTVLPGPAVAFSLSGQPTTIQAGTPFTFSVIVQDAFQNTVTSYAGTVQFMTSDPIGTVPSSYMFNPGVDNGTHVFPATLRRAGAQSITVSAGGIAASMNISVTPAPAQSLIINAPANATSGRPFTVTVITQDPYNNVATGYQGTVQFSTSDASHTLPPNYTFTTGDKGIHYFLNAVTLNTLGTQTVTVTDTVTNSITGSASVNIAHLSGVPRIVRVRLGQPFSSLTLADFTDDQNTSSFSNSIDWGDGTGPTTGTISGGSGSYSISGSHVYTRPPERPITITITDTTHGYPPLSIIVPARMWPKTESH